MRKRGDGEDTGFKCWISKILDSSPVTVLLLVAGVLLFVRYCIDVDCNSECNFRYFPFIFVLSANISVRFIDILVVAPHSIITLLFKRNNMKAFGYWQRIQLTFSYSFIDSISALCNWVFVACTIGCLKRFVGTFPGTSEKCSAFRQRYIWMSFRVGKFIDYKDSIDVRIIPWFRLNLHFHQSGKHFTSTHCHQQFNVVCVYIERNDSKYECMSILLRKSFSLSKQ